jgi:hypothetical protein
MNPRFFCKSLWAGLTVFALSWILLFLGVPFVKTWFFCLAWWSFILVLDSLNFRLRGSSPLSRSPALFFSKALCSVFVWNVFELFNLRLQNWSYHHLPAARPERWLGYFIAFASVIPALEELAVLVGPIFAKRLRLFRVRMSPLLARAGLLCGLLCLVLSFLWPRIFFPLVWLGFIFLLEPLNYRLRSGSFLGGWEKNDWQAFWSWALSGLAAGFFWEFFNFWAGSRWKYHLPYLDFGRVFEMPALGYTGFLPFALEIFAFVQLFLWAAGKIEKRSPLARAAFITSLAVFCGGVFALIDRFTLRG